MGTTIAEDELCLLVLSGLPEEYETLSTVLSTSDKELNLQDMLARLLVVENKSSKPVSEGKVCVARPGNSSSGRAKAGMAQRRLGCAITVASLIISRKTAGSVSKHPLLVSLEVSSLRTKAGEQPKATSLVQLSRQAKAKPGCWTLEPLRTLL